MLWLSRGGYANESYPMNEYSVLAGSGMGKPPVRTTAVPCHLPQHYSMLLVCSFTSNVVCFVALLYHIPIYISSIEFDCHHLLMKIRVFECSLIFVIQFCRGIFLNLKAKTALTKG